MRKIPIAAFFILCVGVMVLAYPQVSSYLAKRQQENVIVGYEKEVLSLDKNTLEEEWEKAREYNEQPHNYMNVLNIEGNGVMGYIEIPKIDVHIPLYHDTTEESLKKGIGHLKQTGLPIGGRGNHPVFTGHRGVPGNELFTRLDEMRTGDQFSLHILGKVLNYEVYRTRVILPEELTKIEEDPKKDLVTLVTCTPYGVNTHRLLIEGERVHDAKTVEEQKEDSTKRNKIVLFIIILLTGVIILLYPHILQKMYSHDVKKQKILYIKECSREKRKLESLYRELKKQNQDLYLNRQENFNSETSYSEPNINLSVYGIKNNTIGYLTIPKMKVSLPVFLGANEENMKKGAVHLTETSYPVGGNNSNSVIAAHRGYSKAAMFRNIELLEIDDKVYLRNFRERLVYSVIETKVIDPSDTDKILIREGKDLLTLITCHPYRQNSKRYVVFCERM